MKRKLVKHGSSTLTISLPAQWVKNNALENGDFLSIDISDRGLFLYPEKPHFDNVQIDAREKDDWYIDKVLTNLYIFGFDEIKISYEGQHQFDYIREILNRLMGFEIIETKRDSCLVKNMASIDNVDYEETTNRILWMVLSQFDNFIEDISNKKLEHYESAINDYKTIFKLLNLSRRLINKKISYGIITSKYVFNFLTSLLNVSRTIYYSYESLKKGGKIDFAHKEIEFIHKTREFYYDLMLAYKNMNLAKIKEFIEEREQISETSLSILREKNPAIIHFFLDVLKELSGISNLIIILAVKN
ncbi:MAG: hypothetical protein AABX53_04270 [Nanoarchaeota archaeon]